MCLTFVKNIHFMKHNFRLHRIWSRDQPSSYLDELFHLLFISWGGITHHHKMAVLWSRQHFVFLKGFNQWQYVTYYIDEWKKCRDCDLYISSWNPAWALDFNLFKYSFLSPNCNFFTYLTYVQFIYHYNFHNQTMKVDFLIKSPNGNLLWILLANFKFRLPVVKLCVALRYLHIFSY